MTTVQNCSQTNDGRATRLPTSAHFLLNDKCNARCVFCGGNYYNSRSGRMMTLEKFKLIANNIHLEHYRQAILAGAGDPLLCPDFVPIMAYVHAAYPSVDISVTTNGIGLNRELSEAMLACGVSMLNVSLNAASGETYQRLMQVDAFDTICRQLRDFSALCRERGRGPQLQLSIPIMRCNLEELPLLIRFAHEVGAAAVNVFYCRFYPREIRNDKDGGFLSDQESLFFHQELSDRIVAESEQLAQQLGVQLFHEPLFSQGSVPKSCSWTENELMIGFDGEVFPCGGGELHFKKRLERGEYDFGNALQQPIEEFWNNDSYRAIRVSANRSGQCAIPECRECSNMTSHMEQRGHILEWADFPDRTRPDAEEPVMQPIPLVSVIVPTHNRPDMLKEAIQSILDQTCRDFEIIVINDAGQDVSSVVQAFNSPKISYLSHETNKGLAAARNTGIRAARGNYIAYLDDDDIFYPEHLETLVTFLQENGQKVAYSDAYRAHQALREDGNYAITGRDLPYSFDFDYQRILIGNFIPVTCIMHDISCIREAGYFDEDLHSHEDWDLWIRISRNCEFHHLKNITCEFRWREDGTSMTSSKELEFISTQERIYEKYQQITSGMPEVVQAQRFELYHRKKRAGVTVAITCSIIIPVYNQVAYTRRCLEMLYANTPEQVSFEVIVVDNASTDATAEFLHVASQLFRNLRIIRNHENLLFAKACNQGARAARGEYLVFLNNDTEPLPHWLDHGLARLKSDPAIGAVGSKLLYPDGTIQHCGIEFIARTELELPWPKHRFLSAAADDPRVNIPEEVPMVTGACLFISQDLFHALGGFCPDYGMYFEDIDLCMKIRKLGKTIWYEPLSVLVHHESKSSLISREQLDSLCQAASVVFYTRWLPEIRTPENTTAVMDRKGKSASAQEASIVIDGVIFQLQHGRPFGISRLWWSLLTELAATPLAGRIVLLDRAGTAPEIPGIRRRSVSAFQLGSAREESPGLDRVCREEGAGLFISTYYTYTSATQSLLMLYDMIPEQFDTVGPTAPNPEWRDKYHAIANSSAFAAISTSTASDLARYYPQAAQRPLTVIPCAVADDFRVHSAEEIAAFKAANGIDRPYFLLVGRRDPHKNAALFFQAFARLPDRERYAIVMAGGGNALEPELRELAGPAAGYAGFFSDQELSLAYSAAIALVYPSRYEGFGLPILEAMQSGCPVITCQNSSLPEVAGSAALYVGEQDPDEMSRALRDVQNADVRSYLIKRGLERARIFSWKRSAAQLIEAIDSLRAGGLSAPRHADTPVGVCASVHNPDNDQACCQPRQGSAASAGSGTRIFPESRLAHQWLDGLQGLEIGPSAHNPFGLNTRNVGIYDEIYEQEQLSVAGTAARLDIVARADQIPLPDESEDFILSSHVIEHCPDLIKTLVEWFRIVKCNGSIFMIVPHRDAAPSDRGRPLTDWQHLLDDFRNGTTELTEPEAGRFGHCHYHVFSPETMKDIMGRIFGKRLVLVAAQDIDDKLGNGFTLVYRKALPNSESLPWEYAPQDRTSVPQHAETIRVSAIVSTYNSESFIRGCLTDLVEQTLYKKGQLEIIVVDSASPQGEGKIVREFQDRFSNIAYIRTDQRETIYQAWNHGIKAARGMYVTNANTDDRHRCDALEVMAAALDANPRVGLVYADALVTNLPNQSFSDHIRCGYHLRPEYSPEIMLSGCHMGPQPMWRRSLHQQIGWFHEKLSSAGDYEFWCRIALHTPLLHLSDFLGLYYENPKGFCNADLGLSTQETALIMQAYRGRLPDPPGSFTNNLQYSGPADPKRFVNIGMITYNRLEFTRQALEALLLATDFPSVVTVVDNASSDGTREYLQEQKRRGIIKNLVLLDENVGVAKASNLAWSLEPASDYYLKLDNDIVIRKPGWLTKMVEAVDRIPLLGAVAYNFEPYSYPLQEAEGCRLRPKGGNLGGACILIPRRTRERLGVWCEEYGLYSEEDADYGRRIMSAGLVNAYMEDEQIGLHLPAGRAAAIDATTFTAADGVEEEMHADYRRWKDDQRRKAIGSGLLERNFSRYATDPSSLYIESRFAADWLQQQPTAEPTSSPAAAATAPRLKVAVYTTDGRTEACPQIRSFLPCRALSESLELLWGVTRQPETRSYDLDTSLAAQADLVVITRFFPSPATADFIEQLLAGPVPVVYDTDDLLTGIDPENTFKTMGDDAAPYIRELIRRADLVTVSNEELQREYAPLARRIVVLPNMLDDSLWGAESIKPANEALVIGYAGGFTHGSDLKIVEEALQWIARKYGDQVRFRFMGCATEALQSLPGFEGIGGVPGYGEFAGMLQQAGFDIALAPLRDTRFNRCKSNVKWLEYSACGFAGVYSDLPPYNGSIEQGQTGLLVENTPQKWFAAIDLLISNPDLRRSIAAHARRKVLADHAPAAQARRYLEAYRSVVDQKKKASGMTPPVADNVPPADPPLVSIVILTFNQLSYTQECLESIRSCTPESHEIIFVDNGSSDGTVEWLNGQAERHGAYHVIANGRNLGFAKGCNQGIEAARGAYILLLNNDVVVTGQWLAGLLECFQGRDEIGIVGPMTNNISGSQKIPRVEYTALSELPEYAARFRAVHRHRRIPARRVVGFCMLFKRRLVDRIGLLDESFGLGNFEDDDFCLRAELAGFQNCIAGDVFVHHYGGVSFDGNNINYSAAMTGNMAIYYRKWNYSLHNETTFRLLPLDAILEARRLAMRAETDAAAQTLLQRGIKIAPANPAPYLALAEILLTAKRYRDALEVIDELPAGADRLLALNLRAAFREGLGDYEAAQHMASEVLAEAPTNARSLNLMGILAYRRDEQGAAAQFFERAMAADLSFGEPCANLGVLKRAAGEHDAAFELLERAAMLSPLDDEIRSLYYGAACETGALDQAEERFSEAVAIYPDCRGLNLFLIDALEKQNSYDAAMHQLEAALVRFGCSDELLEAALEMRIKVGSGSKSGKGNAVSLCMIVRNEQQQLAACLASVKPVVSEIVVVDTGSTDRTIDIATAFGARVFNFTWDGDFSAARNYAIKQATGAWIFVLDADELLSERDHEVFRAVVAQSKGTQLAWSVTTRNYMTDAMQHGWTANSGEYPREERGSGWCPSPKTRLFPRHKHVRFEGPVHEVVEHSLERLKIPVRQAPFVVHHYGHLNKSGMETKKQYYYELAKKKLLARPDDPAALSELAVQAGEVGRFEEALPLWDRVLTIRHSDTQAHFNRSHALNRLKRYAESMEAARQALNIDPGMKEAAFYYATAQLYAGEPAQAEAELLRILALHPAYPPALALLTVIRLCGGDSEAAREPLELLKQISFSLNAFIVDCMHKLADVRRTEFARNLLRLSVQLGCLPQEALTELESCTVPRGPAETTAPPQERGTDDEAALRSAITERAVSEACRLAMRGETDRAVEELLQRGIRVSRDDPAPYLALIDILLSDKRFQDAGQVIPEMPGTTPEATIHALQAVCREGLGEYDLARQSAEQSLALDPRNWRSLNVLGLIAHRNGDQDMAAGYFERAMQADPSAAEPAANRGVIYWSAGERQAGYELLRQAAALAVRDAEIFNLYCAAAAAMGRLDQAVALLRKKLSEYPENRLLVVTLADTLISAEKPGQALDVLLTALPVLGAEGELLDAALELRRQAGPGEPLVGGEQHSVSLCMIVKNEAASLARCLAGVMPVVREMVIVDTGSTDRTIDIATAFGAQVYHFSWSGSFSDARNYALSKARGTWILVLDADEVLSTQDHENLRRTVASSGQTDAWSIIVRNYTERVNAQGWTAHDGLYPSEEQAAGWYPAQRVKLFPNDPRFRFSGEVHELVEPSLRAAGSVIRTASFSVHHYGELLGLPDDWARKQRRYFDLGTQKLAEHPNDLIALTELAVQAGELELFEEALALWDRVLALQPDSVEALFNKGYALIGLKRYQEGLDASRQALERDPDHKEAAFNFGTCALYADDPVSAISVVAPVLARHPDYPLLLALLTVLYLVTGQHDLARTTYTKLVSLNYAIAEYIRDRALDLDNTGRNDMARDLLQGGRVLGIDPDVAGDKGK